MFIKSRTPHEKVKIKQLLTQAIEQKPIGN